MDRFNKLTLAIGVIVVVLGGWTIALLYAAPSPAPGLDPILTEGLLAPKADWAIEAPTSDRTLAYTVHALLAATRRQEARLAKIEATLAGEEDVNDD